MTNRAQSILNVASNVFIAASSVYYIFPKVVNYLFFRLEKPVFLPGNGIT